MNRFAAFAATWLAAAAPALAQEPAAADSVQSLGAYAESRDSSQRVATARDLERKIKSADACRGVLIQQGQNPTPGKEMKYEVCAIAVFHCLENCSRFLYVVKPVLGLVPDTNSTMLGGSSARRFRSFGQSGTGVADYTFKEFHEIATSPVEVGRQAGTAPVFRYTLVDVFGRDEKLEGFEIPRMYFDIRCYSERMC